MFYMCYHSSLYPSPSLIWCAQFEVEMSTTENFHYNFAVHLSRTLLLCDGNEGEEKTHTQQR